VHNWRREAVQHLRSSREDPDGVGPHHPQRVARYGELTRQDLAL